MGDGDGGGGVGGSDEWLPIYDRVEAMLSKSQAQAEALAADRARLEAVNKVQHESWEAAQKLQRHVEELQVSAQEKDAEIGRLRAQAADARKKLQEVYQADASRRRWEAAYMELLLGANQKLAELRESDLEDSITCAENPKFKEVESCAKLSQNTADLEHIASDLRAELRKLKQAYETLNSKKDKEVSALLAEKEALLAEKDFVRNQLSIMEQDYAALLKNKKVEEAQATEAAQELQQNVDELQVAAQKKDDEIGRLRAEAVGAKKKIQEMHSLAKEKDDEIQRLKRGHPETSQKCQKDINETRKKSRSDGPAVRGESNNICPRQMVEEDGQAETCQKRKCASSLSNDDEQSGSDEETTNNQVQKPQGKHKRKRDAWKKRGPGKKKVEQDDSEAQFADGKSHSESDGPVERSWTCDPPAPLRTWKLVTFDGQRFMMPAGNWAQYVCDVKDSLVDQRDKYKEFVRFLRNFETWHIGAVAGTMQALLDGHPELIRRFDEFLPESSWRRRNSSPRKRSRSDDL